MTYFFPMLVLHNEETETFSARFPDLPGCEAQGISLAEVADAGRKALGAYLCEMEENGLLIPAPSSQDMWHSKGLTVCMVTLDMNAYRLYRTYRIQVAEHDETTWTEKKATAKPKGFLSHLFGSTR